MKNKKLVILCIILDIGAIFCLLLAYGPIDKFRSWFVTTSLGSWEHSYFASILYSDSMIDEVLANNTTYQVDDMTDPSKITFSNEDPLVYDSIYEEQILKRDEGNDVYKVIELEGKTFDTGYLLVVYDASRISLKNSPKLKRGGQKITDLAKEFDALAAVNASGFIRNKTTGVVSPDGTLIIDGELYSSKGNALIGFNNDNVLTLIKEDPSIAVANGMKNAVSFGPYLIVNGVPSTFKGGGGYGLRPRTAIGQRQDGTVLFVVIDGNNYATEGIDMEELTNIFIRYGAYNAANLDGGGSSSLYAGGELINKPCGWKSCQERWLLNAWIIK